jgi:hypothetical protein
MGSIVHSGNCPSEAFQVTPQTLKTLELMHAKQAREMAKHLEAIRSKAQ